MLSKLKDGLVLIFALAVIAGIWLGGNELQGLNQPWEGGSAESIYSCSAQVESCELPQATPVTSWP